MLDAYELTRRERQISHLVSYGLSTGEIAARLGLSPHTVRDYLKRIFEKVGVSSRGELVGRIYAEHYGPRLDASIVESLAGDATASRRDVPAGSASSRAAVGCLTPRAARAARSAGRDSRPRA